MFLIDRQNVHRDLAHRRDANKTFFPPVEVVLLVVAPWVELRGQGLGFGIDADNVRPFVRIAEATGKREILPRRFPGVLPGDDVINDKREREEFFREPAPADAGFRPKTEFPSYTLVVSQAILDMEHRPWP